MALTCRISTLSVVLTIPIFVATSQTWQTQLVNPGSINNPRSVCYDDSGFPIVIYTVNAYQIFFSRWNGTSWESREIVHAQNYSATFIAAIRKDSLIHCFYYYSSNYYTYDVQLRLDGTVKTSTTVGYTSGSDGDVAVEPTGEMVFVYSYNGIRARRYSFSTNVWSPEEIVDGSVSLSNPAIATSSSGAIWVAYKDGLGLNLKVARSNATGWNVWFVDTDGNVGQNPQIQVDASNTAHITYYDATNRSLKYATFSAP